MMMRKRGESSLSGLHRGGVRNNAKLKDIVADWTTLSSVMMEPKTIECYWEKEKRKKVEN